MTSSRTARIALGVASAVLGALVLVALLAGQAREPVADAVAEVVVGWSFVGAGLIASARRPGSRTGLLMIVIGFAWLARELQYFETSLTYTFGMFIESFQWLVMSHLLATYPTGRVNDRLERVTVWVIYLYAVPNAFGSLPFDEARPPGCPDCPANLLSIHPHPGLADAAATALTIVPSLFAPVVIACFLRRWRRATPSGRRAFTPVFAGALVVFVVAMAGFVSVGPLDRMPDWIVQLAFLSLSGGLLAGLLRGWLDRQALSKLMPELGRASTPDRLRHLLAQALHDPTLELLYWDDGARAYLDAEGQAWELPRPTAQRAVTSLNADERPVGALLHDPLLLDDPVLVHAVGEAARFALDNDRLQAAVRAQVEELRASRQRIAEAAISERRRVERDLHDGAQQRLITLSLAIAMAEERAAETTDPELAEMLSEVKQEATAALAELRELARGIHPPLLAEAGLGPALASLAARAPVPARVVSAPGQRLSDPVEATAYFVVSECLANIAKHARASSATISAEVANGELVLEVADDGVGGADRGAGSGLTGLDDRVMALGGRLELDSPPGEGTRLTVRIPCA